MQNYGSKCERRLDGNTNNVEDEVHGYHLS
jgi:hypothetical protein